MRGKGLFCRSIMKSQMASPTFTPVFAALVAVVNTKFPEIGQLLLHRLVLQVNCLCWLLSLMSLCSVSSYIVAVCMHPSSSSLGCDGNLATCVYRALTIYCVQFKRAFKRNDKPICLAVSKFIGHLVNQQVADDMIAFEIALLLLEVPSGTFTPSLLP